MNNEKGYLYEIQIRDYIINNLNKMAYLWSHTPEMILLENNIIGTHNDARLKRKELKEDKKLNPLQDTGIDVIQLEDDGKCAIVQCKNGYKKGVTMNDLAGFMCWMAHLDQTKGYVYYTDKLSLNLRSLPTNPRIKYIKEPYIEPVKNDIESKIFNIDNEKLKYQQIAFEAANEYYKDTEPEEDDDDESENELDADEDDDDEDNITNNNGIISMPCGTGKTYTSYLISQLFNQIIILSPLKQFAKQNLDKYIEYGYSSSTLLVDSDGCRDIDTIKKFIKDNPRFVISSTYDSVDVIYQSLDVMTKPFFIIDEFHNLSKNNVTNEDDIFYKLIHTNHKKLFMSATPRVYEMENETDNGFYDVIFGNVIYNMNFKEAIDNKYITDYKIWFPSIHENTDLLDKELSIYDIDEVLKSKCKFLFSCLVNNGSRKCIVYCTDTNEMKKMMDAIKLLDDKYYCLDYHMDYITSDVSHKLRDTRLKHFADSTKIELLFSVRILDECIDIPSCDSIFITYPSKSKIRTIQRLSRCTRTNPNNKFKTANIFIWCDEYNKILETLSGIKEYDPEFREKIKLNINGSHSHLGDLIPGMIDDNKVIRDFLMGIKEFKFASWDEKLEKVKKYIDENNKRPSKRDKHKEIKTLGIWLSHQQQNYKTRTEILKSKEVYNQWNSFINDDKYKEYFLDNNTIWYNTLNQVKKYIDENKKRPTQTDKDKEIKTLGKWLSHQQQKYKTKSQIMKIEDIYNQWTDFITDDKYKDYFLDNDIIWINKLEEVKKYIDDNKKRPSSTSKNKELKTLGSWIGHQQKNYKTKTHIMKSEEIYNQWTIFINDDKYNEYFLDNDIIWCNTLNQVKKYINENNKRPSAADKDKEIKTLGCWISCQQKNYKTKSYIMSSEEIYNKWTDFINNSKYNEYFLDNDIIWSNTLEQVKKYIDENKKRPSAADKENEIKTLGQWISDQQKKYKNKSYIMSTEEIYNQWTSFINDDRYKEYFLDNDIVWSTTLEKVKKYIDDNNKRPSSESKYKEIKTLGIWIGTQQSNYKTKSKIMSSEEIYTEWTDFINDDKYKEYFLDNDIIWSNTLEQVKKYIDDYKKRPSTTDKDKEIKTLGAWISNQQKNYKTKSHIMSSEEIYNEWATFINDDKYKDYFLDNDIIWNNNLEKVKKYIDDNKKRPATRDKDKEIKTLGSWFSHQQNNYKTKTNIMSSEEIYNQWTSFMNDDKYKEYF